ncbi:E3 ubiquitin-protein ligase parkin [Eumeta japonica]|uniref:E3 ubiquitin-protein ligase parkin n=1 Tax=Eumeta variegata TaxID=151549 RepID=A0A4C1TI88_EUMVA|nr:E3 ubiquitin-protein ligase parkin [Eumeta japonica]
MLQLLTFGKNRITNGLSIYVKTNVGSTLTLEIDPKWDIKNVKEIVAPQLGLQPEEVKIIFAGKELSDSTVIEECDLGQKSILHAVKSSKRKQSQSSNLLEHINEEGSRPLSETLLDLQLTQRERNNVSESEKQKLKAHFYVFCSHCQKLAEGKLRVCCASCETGAFTVHSDPQSWDDVLKDKQITGECHNEPSCSVVLHEDAPTFARFYFKCAEHESQGEKDWAVPLYLIKPNLKEIPCLACSDVKLRDRQFLPHPEIGYTLPCPAGCENSFIEEIHHFHLLTKELYDQYQRFAAEEYVLQAGGVLCPQPGCGMGILAEENCIKITCQTGCGYVFCRKCLQGYHIGDCDSQSDGVNNIADSCQYTLDPNRVSESRVLRDYVCGIPLDLRDCKETCARPFTTAIARHGSACRCCTSQCGGDECHLSMLLTTANKYSLSFDGAKN